MTEKQQSKTSNTWQPFAIQTAKNKFSSELFEDLQSLESFGRKTEKEITFDIMELKTIFLIIVALEDAAWIYEIDKESPQYFRQICLTRDDLAFIFRRMNEKRRIRFV